MDPITNAHVLTDDVGFLLSRASGLFVRATNAALLSYGLRVRSYSVLLLACEAAEGVTQRDLAEVLGLDPSQVVLLVDELADSGLVERRPSDSDRRTKLVVATAAGHALRAEAVVEVGAAVSAQLADLTGTEQFLLRDLLGRLVRGNGGAFPA
ncbi:MarR family winged helix-turn-helix transcriptional regulator [Blastococcus haudaquaticus]|uniref:DNA-binding transcriptional regulator, MarR family n=1 Tax=Blastococcus haudaquaticus TaxID=1938745 RepID=A0A286GS20_9ACTN|nr:MarR family transcriptional regulator [Blastococcus haudaquaticus]SOD98318.1 DNA-binding transcriptional regulator, MarR family [Blastococcus haudaquaticus]